MALYKKGELSRAEMINRIRDLLNNQGMGLGIEAISQDLGLSRGRITHFFPTRQSMMRGIMQEYERRLGEMLQDFDWNAGTLFDQFFEVLDRAMDLQYEFRCITSYVASIGKHQTDMLDQMEAAYLNRLDGIRMRVNTMTVAKILEPRIMETKEFDLFGFQYITLLTSWVTSHDLYHRNKTYASMKTIYIRGAMQLFQPYLTKKGWKVYRDAEERFLKKTIQNIRPAKNKKESLL